MNMKRYSNQVLEALLAARKLAKENDHPAVEPAHVLFALLAQINGVVPRIVSEIGHRPSEFMLKVQSHLIGNEQKVDKDVPFDLGPSMVSIMDYAEQLGDKMQNDSIFPEHVLIALAEKSVVRGLMQEYGLTRDAIVQAAIKVHGVKMWSAIQ